MVMLFRAKSTYMGVACINTIQGFQPSSGEVDQYFWYFFRGISDRLSGQYLNTSN